MRDFLMRGALAAALTFAAAPARAQSVDAPNEPNRAHKEGKVVRAHRVATPPSIDGRLSDEVWSVAESASGLIHDQGELLAQPVRSLQLHRPDEAAEGA